ncbi:deoxyribose-phosphate aldolase [Cytophagales bacterium LB-30]|uniref:Deoxyribose-phosphate aldolase n=1 Tax=Shiella aurantiaca TaxID=3058365 RepID=A0ABT8F5I5_9BACT|nr:deoxyribose-phosphate aldolase [Shiella aurantiaca]MDN4165692.1 deoxyribose-phosphate aldolase [Shiella aurantiaca]
MHSLARYIEHTLLRPNALDREIDALVAEAKEHGFVGVCVPPFWVKRASREIGSADVQLVTVVGFPFGYQMTEVKLEETRLALRDGANEIDMVMNISSFLSGFNWTKIDIVKMAQLCHEHQAMLKVIIETALLTDEQIKTATLLCKDAGADFVKTSTGYAAEGAKVEHIKLMRSVLPSSVGVKASGGIKTYEQALALINAGADRIGTSSGVAICQP